MRASSLGRRGGSFSGIVVRLLLLADTWKRLPANCIAFEPRRFSVNHCPVRLWCIILMRIHPIPTRGWSFVRTRRITGTCMHGGVSNKRAVTRGRIASVPAAVW
jgi:hypothetical protein